MNGRGEEDGDPPERLPFEGLVAEVLRDAASATRGEARAEIERSDSSLRLRDGYRVGSVGHEQVWSYSVEGDDEIAPETPGRLLVGDQAPLNCRVLAAGTGNVLLSVRTDLGPSATEATLSTSAGFVLQRLADRLDDLAVDGTADSTLVESLIHPDAGSEDPGFIPLAPDDEDEESELTEQERAAQRAIEPGLRFTWGPPGTGKTGVLAQAVALAVDAEQRVLVLAHANAAVDVAAVRIAEALDGYDELSSGQVLRVGTPQLVEVIDRHDILPEHIVSHRHPDLTDRRKKLEQERRDLSDVARKNADGAATQPGDIADRLTEVRGQLRQIRALVDEARSELIREARVVITTLSKGVIDDEVWRWDADVVLVDEASMAPYPAVLGFAARGATTLSCVGDFRQLPPVAISEDPGVRHWFAQDVFTHAAVTSTYEAGQRDQRLCALWTQYRMGEVICATVGDLAYDGALITAPPARNRGIRLSERWPGEGSELVVVDTSRLGTTCREPAAADNRSRMNLLSGAVSIALAEALAAHGGGVGLISPYRAQVDLLRAANRQLRAFTTGTIHRFQGSEQDTIVLDLVDAPGGDGASVLTGTDRDLSRRLVNVAASRARGKLIVVADVDFVERQHPPTSASRRFLELAVQHGAEVIDAVAVVDGLPAPETATVAFHPDLESAFGAVLPDRRAATVSVDTDHRSAVDRWCDAALRAETDVDVTRATAIRRANRAAKATDFADTGPPAPWPISGVAVVDDAVLVVSGRTGPVAVVTSPSTVVTYRRLTS